MALAILHREPSVETIPAGTATWRTCLREVQFLNETDGLPAPSPSSTCDQRLQEGHAYRVLLEILCGLQSPMIGETQVLGQFKSFLTALDGEHAWLSRVGQRLLTDARDVRATHLQGLGSRSYGSAVRRELDGAPHAVLVGTGKLAAEVLPFLAGDGRTIDQWGRSDAIDHQGRPAAADASDAAQYYRLHRIAEGIDASRATRPTVLVVAAPVATDVVERVAAWYPALARMIDLRADLGDRRPAIGVAIVSLQDLFARMHDSQTSAAPQIDAARQDIAWRARQYELRDEPRPFGWDDLCA